MKFNRDLLKVISLINKEIEEGNSSYCLLVSLSNDFSPVKCSKIALNLNDINPHRSTLDLKIDIQSIESISDYIINSLKSTQLNTKDYTLHIIDSTSNDVLKTIDIKNCHITELTCIDDDNYQITLTCDTITNF
jgi:hypothetical protein